MIKANYVRVNNYVSYKGNIITVVPKTIDDIGFQQSLNSEFYTGIPITEEWLLKFGSEQYPHMYIFDEIEFNSCDDGSFRFHYTYSNYIEIKYVHQLQNLYFALTGKELTL